MVRLVSLSTAFALAGLQAQLTTADNNGFRGAKRVDCNMSDWSPFEACSAAGYKTQTRLVVVQPSAGGSPCPSTVYTASCSKKECWMGPWSDWVCDSSTGMKQRSREITPGGVQETKKCPAKVQQAVCDPIPCVINTLEEDAANPWGECTFKRGQWTKTKALGVKAPAQYGGLCFEPTHPMRKVTAPCAPVNCVVTPVEMDTGAWGECKETSPNVWIKTKTLSIQTVALYGGTPCSDTSRVATASCAQDCKWSSTEYGEWTACDTTNTKYHPFKITQEAAFGGVACPPIAQRADSATCPPVNCVITPVELDTGAWGDCQETSPNVWIKAKTLSIQTAAMYGGTSCSDSSRVATASCAQDCKWSTTEYEEWTVCDGTNVKYHPFKIIQEAAFGGTTCPPIAQRADSQPCPVNCVVTPLELDTGAWSECKETSPNVWTKTKTLSIQTVALYGGLPCSDTSRVATASCAQDCKWSSTEYEEWTPCDATNTKYHPFKITQQAAFGGVACPPIAQRADSATCPPVNCWGDCLRVANHWIRSPTVSNAACPAPKSCDVEHYCNSLTDAAAKSECTAALQKSGVITTGYFWVVKDWSKAIDLLAPTLAGCINACATTAGCLAYNYYPEAKGSYQGDCMLMLELTERRQSSGPNTISAELIRA